MPKVAVVKTSPKTVYDDIARLMDFADYDKYVSKDVMTTIKLNLSWSKFYPACSTNPYIFDGLLRKLIADGFDNHNIQIIKMNHVGSNPVVQLPLSYHYRCNACGQERDLAFDVKSIPCGEECSGAMIRVKSRDIVRPAYASRVITDDLNSISIVSLSEIPQGEFIGAVFFIALMISRNIQVQR